MVNAPKITVGDYVNFLIASPNRFTCTEAARTQPQESDAAHDAYTRLLQRLPDNTNLLWEESKEFITFKGLLLIDDSVIDKPFANKMELVSYFWSGNHHQVVKGIDVITALWTNGKRIIPTDFRVYNDFEGKTKNDYFCDLIRVAKDRQLHPEYVGFDSWYSGLDNLKLIRKLDWEWITRFKENRLVNPDGKPKNNVNVSTIEIPENGRIVHLKGYGYVKVFRFVSGKGDIEYWATSDLKMTKEKWMELKGKTWKIEEYHRGIKQCCGAEDSQIRNAGGQKNHILLSIVAFLKLEFRRIKVGASWYETKESIICNAVRFFRTKPFIF